MSENAVLRTNLAAITCDPRPQLPDGFRRNSTRVGAALGATRTGLSVYELPGQAVSPYHYEDPTRNGSSWCRAHRPCAVPAARRSWLRGTSCSSPRGRPERISCATTVTPTARVAMLSSASSPAGAVVYPDRDMVWMWTDDGAVDMIVRRGSAEDDIAPWTTDGDAGK